MVPRPAKWRDVPSRHRPHPLGAHLRPDGTGLDVAILASHAERVDLCLFIPTRKGWYEERLSLPEETHGVWHAFVPGVTAGQRYGFRVHGRWEPHRGLRHNPNKLLLDPYARAISGEYRLRPELFGHCVNADFLGDDTVLDPRDSAPFAPVAVVTAAAPARARDDRPRVPWSETVIYELHVKGFSKLITSLPPDLRGTYAGLGHPSTIAHLVSLGVTTVELLPVHAIGGEPVLQRGGLPNYWGYSTLSFFAPHAGYARATEPQEVLAEFRTMVGALHAAGIEVVLDVVYNHTCEAGVTGPMISWRGLDAATYYRLDAHGRDVDTTGCGNSLDFSNARVVQMALDSLRYWMSEMHVDGFRFDLATTLARGRDGFDPDHPFLVALRTDPVLVDAKLIMEPWDIGPHGWRTGQFPPPVAEWNDRFRDSVREFWLAGAGRAARGWSGGGVRDLATRLAGSADVFGQHRGPQASVNFIDAHDGFPLADLAAYEHKHNEDNGEDNRDGSSDNRSWNHGVEGPTTDPEILESRTRSVRNLLATLLLATGVPMLVAGDEFGRTQGGNNNAYCQDNAISWVDWNLADWQQDLLLTTRHLLALRRRHPVLRQERFFAGRPVHGDGTKDLAWFGPDGVEMDHARWHDPGLRSLQMYLHAVQDGGRGHHLDESLLVVVQGGPAPGDITLPGAPWGRAFRLLWDSAWPQPPHGDGPPEVAGTRLSMVARSLRVYGVVPVRTHERPS